MVSEQIELKQSPPLNSGCSGTNRCGVVTLESPSVTEERIRAFWAGSSLGRPALHVTVRNPAYVQRQWDGPTDPTWRKRLDLDPGFHAHCTRRQLDSRIFMAEALPCLTVVYGSNLALLPMLIGGDYEYVDGSHSAWISPDGRALEAPVPRFDPAHPAVKGLERCLTRVAEVASGRASLNPPIMGLDAVTCLSLLRGADQLCMDMIERPEQVQCWTAAATEVIVAAYKHFYEFVTQLGYTRTSSWLCTSAPGTFEAVQCDFAVMISPDLFQQFVIPDLVRMTEFLDYSLYHLDGVEQLRFLPQLAELPRLNGIQWNPQPAGRPALKWLDAFREIRRLGLCLQFNDCEVAGVDEAVELTRALGPDGVMIGLPMFETVDDAVAAIERIERACD